jgi:hypothetical protein
MPEVFAGSPFRGWKDAVYFAWYFQKLASELKGFTTRSGSPSLFKSAR